MLIRNTISACALIMAGELQAQSRDVDKDRKSGWQTGMGKSNFYYMNRSGAYYMAFSHYTDIMKICLLLCGYNDGHVGRRHIIQNRSMLSVKFCWLQLFIGCRLAIAPVLSLTMAFPALVLSRQK